MSSPTRTIKLSGDEFAEYAKFRVLSSCDSDMKHNTFPEYHKKLKDWTSRIQKKYHLKESESFFFQ